MSDIIQLSKVHWRSADLSVVEHLLTSCLSTREEVADDKFKVCQVTSQIVTWHVYICRIVSKTLGSFTKHTISGSVYVWDIDTYLCSSILIVVTLHLALCIDIESSAYCTDPIARTILSIKLCPHFHSPHIVDRVDWNRTLSRQHRFTFSPRRSKIDRRGRLYVDTGGLLKGKKKVTSLGIKLCDHPVFRIVQFLSI
jgi:hypothetical protein